MLGIVTSIAAFGLDNLSLVLDTSSLRDVDDSIHDLGADDDAPVKRARGERISRQTPYGQRVAVDGVHLEPDPAEQAVIERARLLRASGLSVRAVAEELEVEGLMNRAGKPLSVAAVHAMLKV